MIRLIHVAKADENNYGTVIVSASIESQIAEFDNDNDRIELLKELGLKETTLKKLITAPSLLTPLLM